MARARQEVAGYAYAGPWRRQPAYRHTVEDSVYLAAGRTGRGLGRALLGPLLARCADAGVRQVVAVIADAGSEASVALHRSFGFVDAGRLDRRRPQARHLDRHGADAARPDQAGLAWPGAARRRRTC